LDYNGINVPPQHDNANWSHNFINWLKKLDCGHPSNRLSLSFMIRKHRQLRSDLVECAWTAKRTDPALALYYNEQLKKGKNGKAAIIKVARKLLGRIRHVWLTGEPYQVSVVK